MPASRKPARVNEALVARVNEKENGINIKRD
jgi:hypothetical protein